MNVTAIFVLLSAMAAAGAGGLLFCRRLVHCAFSFAFCCAALAGLYLLLNQHFLAALQLALGMSLSGMLIAITLPSFDAYATARGDRLRPYALLAGLLFLVLCVWGIADASIGTPELGSTPVWATSGEHVPALGRELSARYSIPFLLLGLLLLTALVSAAHLLRQDTHTSPKGRDK